MSAKYLVPVLIFVTLLFWILALLIPSQAILFLLLRDIVFGIFLIYGGILLGLGAMLLTQYENIEYKNIKSEKFEKTLADNIVIHGEIFTGTTEDFTNSSPVVLMCHGWGGQIEALYSYIYPLVVQGYKVITYNHRGHGKKPYKSGGNRPEVDKTFMDVQQIVDFIVERPDLNHQKLGAIGFSLGGYTLLTGGYLDSRIKLIIAFCAGHDWMEMNKFWSWYVRLFFRLTGLIIYPSENLNRKLSPKYFLQKKMDKVVCLAHVKNDRVVPYDGFLKNKELLQLPDENIIEFDKGDHIFHGQTTVALSQTIKWLNIHL